MTEVCAERFKLILTVHLVLIKEQKILLSLRKNTGYGDGLYSLVSGTLDGGETATEATIREAKEEIGICISPSDLTYLSTMHCLSESKREYVELFFATSSWKGEIQNMEPDKCERVEFFDRNNLPENMIPYVRRGLENIGKGRVYDEHGFN
jgi:8-oxo-dGTP diphosphatase